VEALKWEIINPPGPRNWNPKAKKGCDLIIIPKEWKNGLGI